MPNQYQRKLGATVDDVSLMMAYDGFSGFEKRTASYTISTAEDQNATFPTDRQMANLSRKYLGSSIEIFLRCKSSLWLCLEGDTSVVERVAFLGAVAAKTRMRA